MQAQSRLALRTGIWGLVAGIHAPLFAQAVLFQWPSPPSMELGSVAAVGDFDGDAVPDFAYTQPTYSPTERGRLVVRSGRNGAILLDRASPIVGDGFGAVVTGLGDVDGDGRADLAVASRGEVLGLRGGTGALLWRVPAGGVHSLAAVPDLDLDGASDWAAGAPNTTGPAVGAVRIHSGRTGALLSTIVPPTGASPYFGDSVALVGDFDLDGRADLAIGDSYGGAGFGSVSVHGLATAALLQHLQAAASPFATSTTGFGAAVASPGDIDGDAIPELLVGAPYELLATPGTHGGPTGRVRLLSGATGAQLLAFTQNTYGGGFGVGVGTYPDLDGDGLAEIWMVALMRRVGCCLSFPGELRIHSSATGAELLELADFGATRVAVVQDVNADGYDELLAAQAPAHGSPTRLLLPFADPLVGITGCVPKLTSQGCVPLSNYSGCTSLTIGDDLRLSASALVPGSVGMFLFGTQPAATPFAGGTLCVGGRLRRLGLQPTAGASACSGAISLDVPKSLLASISGGPGSTLYIQGWFRDSGFPAPNDVGLSMGFGLAVWP